MPLSISATAGLSEQNGYTRVRQAGARLDREQGDPIRAHHWVIKVERIVLLATPNRGFQMSRLPFRFRWWMRLFAVPMRFTMAEGQAGSPYITTLRLHWMNYFDTSKATALPLVVQLLGDPGPGRPRS